MKDLHTHILYGIDDGSIDYENSVRLLKKMEEASITDIVLTPHYIIGSKYNSDNKEKKRLQEKLMKETNIKLYLGNEIYIDNDILEYIEKDEISSINNTKYLLIEFPLSRKLTYMDELIFKLRKKGYIPIIAHPERYHYFKVEDLIELIESGCLLQGNITSLSNKYGGSAKRNLELLIKKKMIHVLGTDTHRDFDCDLDDALNKLRKITSSEYYLDLTEKNFDRIVNNKKVDVYDIVKTSSFFRKEKIR